MLLEKRRKTPAAARNFLKALQALFKWAVDNKKATHNPTLNVENIPYSTKGHHSWTTEEITLYEQRHPVGTLASLAKAILFYTGCRREDAVRLGPQHIRNGRLQFTQAKNEHRNPVYIDIPSSPKIGRGHCRLSLRPHDVSCYRKRQTVYSGWIWEQVPQMVQ